MIMIVNKSVATKLYLARSARLSSDTVPPYEVHTIGCAIRESVQYYVCNQARHRMTPEERIEQFKKYNNDNYVDMILPTELASGLINNDWSFIDYIGDEEYAKIINYFTNELAEEGLDCVDVYDDSSFVSYHDLTDDGVLATDCSTFIFRKG